MSLGHAAHHEDRGGGQPAVAGRQGGQLERRHLDRVQLTPRVRCHLASWTLVQAELAALAAAYASSRAEHFVVMSGSDYPLAPVEAIVTELENYASSLADRLKASTSST